MIFSKKKYRYLWLALCMVLGAGTQVKALAPELTARLDSGNLLMGNMGMLHLQVVLDRGQSFKFPVFDSPTQDGLIMLLGDTVELRSTFSQDTVSLGGQRIQINCHVPMQAFVPGTYLLPSITVYAGNDTAKSLPLALKVTGPDVTAKDSISPDMGPLQPYYEKGYQETLDKVPNLIYYYWWLIVIIVLALGLLVWWLLKRSGKKMPWNKPKPVIPPYDLAMQRMRKLRSGNLCEQGQEKQYYSELTDIMRQYLLGRFGINALEMTSGQIRKAVADSAGAREGRKYVEDVLNMADVVKFAKFKPLPDENVSAFENVLKFLELTKPVPEEEQADDAGENDGQEKKSDEKSTPKTPAGNNIKNSKP